MQSRGIALAVNPTELSTSNSSAFLELQPVIPPAPVQFNRLRGSASEALFSQPTELPRPHLHEKVSHDHTQSAPFLFKSSPATSPSQTEYPLVVRSTVSSTKFPVLSPSIHTLARSSTAAVLLSHGSAINIIGSLSCPPLQTPPGLVNAERLSHVARRNRRLPIKSSTADMFYVDRFAAIFWLLFTFNAFLMCGCLFIFISRGVF